MDTALKAAKVIALLSLAFLIIQVAINIDMFTWSISRIGRNF